MMKIAKVVSILLVLIPFMTFGQETVSALKIGYANPQAILAYLPESKTIKKELEAYMKQLDTQYRTKMEDYQLKLQDFQQKQNMLTDVVKADKQEELVNLQNSIRKFEQEAQQAFENKKLNLLEPIYEKIGKAIQEVAEEKGYTMILNSETSSGFQTILYASATNNLDELVLAKLGIKPESIQRE
jgi:outer membrane protein